MSVDKSLNESRVGRQHLQDSIVSLAQQSTQFIAAREWQEESGRETLLDHIKEKQAIILKLKSLIEEKCEAIQSDNNERNESKSLFLYKSQETGQVSISQLISQGEQSIKQELNQIKDQLETLYVFMSRDNQMSNLTEKELTVKLQDEENALEQLEQEKQRLEAEIKDIEEDADILHGKEIKKFKRVLQEMEEAERAIAKKKEDLKQRISSEQQRYKIASQFLDITIEDRESTTDQIHDLQQQLSLKEKEILDLKIKHPEITSYFEKQEKSKKELEGTRQTVSKWNNSSNTLQSTRHQQIFELERLDRLSETLKAKIISIKYQKFDVKSKVAEDIQNLESIIHSSVLDQAVSGILFARGYESDLTLKRRQLSLLIQQQTTQKDNFTSENNATLAHLSNLHTQVITQWKKYESIKNSVGDNIKEKKMGQVKYENELLEVFEQLKEQYKLEQFNYLINKETQRVKLNRLNREVDALREEILEMEQEADMGAQDLTTMIRVDQMTIEEVISITGNRTLREPLNQLYDILKARELELFNFIEEERLLFQQAKETEDARKALAKAIGTMTTDEQLLRKRATLHQITETTIGTKMENIQAKKELGVLEKGSDAFGQYSEDHFNEYLKIKREGGQMAPQKAKDQDKYGISEISMYQQKKVFLQVCAVYNRRNELQKAIEHSQQRLSDLEKDVQHATEEVTQLNQHITHLNTQLDIIIDTERDHTEEIEKTLRKKKEQIEYEVNLLYHNRQYEQKQESLTANGVNIGKKKNYIKQIQMEIQFSQQSQEMNQEYCNNEKISLEKRQSELNKTLKNLKHKIKPELHRLSAHINSLRESILSNMVQIESWYSKAQATLRSLSFAKQTLVDRYDEEVECHVEESVELLETEINQVRDIGYQVNMSANKELQESKENPFAETLRLPGENNFSSAHKRELSKEDLVTYQEEEGVSPDSESKQSTQVEQMIIQTSKGESYTVILKDLPPSEIEFYKSIEGLLQGQTLYKQLNDINSLKKEPFNVLRCADISKSSALGQRYFVISGDFQTIDIYKISAQGGSRGGARHQHGKWFNPQSSELKLAVKDIQKIVLPVVTQDILRLQKKNRSDLAGEALLVDATGSGGSMFVGKLTKKFKDDEIGTYIQCQYFPFQVVTDKKTFDLIAVGLDEFRRVRKSWDALVQWKKDLKRLNKKLLK